MRRLLAIAIIFFLTASVQFNVATKTVFAVRVAFQGNGQMFTIMAYFNNGTNNTYKRVLTMREFCFYASGTWPSIYNRNQINLFELNNVEGGVLLDEFSRKPTHPYCPSLDSLWKLRFDSYPFVGMDNGDGWSHDKWVPGKRQMNYLTDQYGVGAMDTHYFADTSFWKILRDVVDPEWIENYRYMQ